MTRITETQIVRNSLALIQKSRSDIAKFSQETSSGIKIARPGDDAANAPTVASLRETINRFDKHKLRIQSASSTLSLQTDVLAQASDLLVRAKELASQGANEVLGAALRESLSHEVFQLRDAMVDLANTKFQGRYLYSGVADDQPAYSPTGTPGYTNSTSQPGSIRYTYNTNAGSDLSNSVYISDDTSITTNTPGNGVFDGAIQALEILGRSLEGYRSTTTAGVPDGGGTAYTFPTDFSEQTQDILNAMTRLDTARTSDIAIERVSVAGKESRILNSTSILESLKSNLIEVLSKTQGADIFESATNLTQAQTALQTSLSVSGSILKISLLDYL